MSREVRKVCDHCQGTGHLCTALGILLPTASGKPRPCHVCHGRGVRVWEEFTEEEFRRRFPKGVPLRGR
jgi:DnaJ-class molecular chaperone